MRRCTLMLLLAVLLTANTSAAAVFRCGQELISPGDSKTAVLLACGQPHFRELVAERTYYRKYRFAVLETTVVVEQWTYHLGPAYFLRILTFEGSRLVAVELGERP